MELETILDRIYETNGGVLTSIPDFYNYLYDAGNNSYHIWNGGENMFRSGNRVRSTH